MGQNICSFACFMKIPLYTRGKHVTLITQSAYTRLLKRAPSQACNNDPLESPHGIPDDQARVRNVPLSLSRGSIQPSVT